MSGGTELPTITSSGEKVDRGVFYSKTLKTMYGMLSFPSSQRTVPFVCVPRAYSTSLLLAELQQAWRIPLPHLVLSIVGQDKKIEEWLESDQQFWLRYAKQQGLKPRPGWHALDKRLMRSFAQLSPSALLALADGIKSATRIPAASMYSRLYLLRDRHFSKYFASDAQVRQLVLALSTHNVAVRVHLEVGEGSLASLLGSAAKHAVFSFERGHDNFAIRRRRKEKDGGKEGGRILVMNLNVCIGVKWWFTFAKLREHIFEALAAQLRNRWDCLHASTGRKAVFDASRLTRSSLERFFACDLRFSGDLRLDELDETPMNADPLSRYVKWLKNFAPPGVNKLLHCAVGSGCDHVFAMQCGSAPSKLQRALLTEYSSSLFAPESSDQCNDRGQRIMQKYIEESRQYADGSKQPLMRKRNDINDDNDTNEIEAKIGVEQPNKGQPSTVRGVFRGGNMLRSLTTESAIVHPDLTDEGEALANHRVKRLRKVRRMHEFTGRDYLQPKHVLRRLDRVHHVFRLCGWPKAEIRGRNHDTGDASITTPILCLVRSHEIADNIATRVLHEQRPQESAIGDGQILPTEHIGGEQLGSGSKVPNSQSDEDATTSNAIETPADTAIPADGAMEIAPAAEDEEKYDAPAASQRRSILNPRGKDNFSSTKSSQKKKKDAIEVRVGQAMKYKAANAAAANAVIMHLMDDFDSAAANAAGLGMDERVWKLDDSDDIAVKSAGMAESSTNDDADLIAEINACIVGDEIGGWRVTLPLPTIDLSSPEIANETEQNAPTNHGLELEREEGNLEEDVEKLVGTEHEDSGENESSSDNATSGIVYSTKAEAHDVAAKLIRERRLSQNPYSEPKDPASLETTKEAIEPMSSTSVTDITEPHGVGENHSNDVLGERDSGMPAVYHFTGRYIWKVEYSVGWWRNTRWRQFGGKIRRTRLSGPKAAQFSSPACWNKRRCIALHEPLRELSKDLGAMRNPSVVFSVRTAGAVFMVMGEHSWYKARHGPEVFRPLGFDPRNVGKQNDNNSQSVNLYESELFEHSQCGSVWGGNRVEFAFGFDGRANLTDDKECNHGAYCKIVGTDHLHQQVHSQKFRTPPTSVGAGKYSFPLSGAEFRTFWCTYDKISGAFSMGKGDIVGENTWLDGVNNVCSDMRLKDLYILSTEKCDWKVELFEMDHFEFTNVALRSLFYSKSAALGGSTGTEFVDGIAEVSPSDFQRLFEEVGLICSADSQKAIAAGLAGNNNRVAQEQKAAADNAAAPTSQAAAMANEICDTDGGVMDAALDDNEEEVNVDEGDDSESMLGTEELQSWLSAFAPPLGGRGVELTRLGGVNTVLRALFDTRFSVGTLGGLYGMHAKLSWRQPQRLRLFIDQLVTRGIAGAADSLNAWVLSSGHSEGIGELVGYGAKSRNHVGFPAIGITGLSTLLREPVANTPIPLTIDTRRTSTVDEIRVIATKAARARNIHITNDDVCGVLHTQHRRKNLIEFCDREKVNDHVVQDGAIFDSGPRNGKGSTIQTEGNVDTPLKDICRPVSHSVGSVGVAHAASDANLDDYGGSEPEVEKISPGIRHARLRRVQSGRYAQKWLVEFLDAPAKLREDWLDLEGGPIAATLYTNPQTAIQSPSKTSRFTGASNEDEDDGNLAAIAPEVFVQKLNYELLQRASSDKEGYLNVPKDYQLVAPSCLDPNHTHFIFVEDMASESPLESEVELDSSVLGFSHPAHARMIMGITCSFLTSPLAVVKFRGNFEETLAQQISNVTILINGELSHVETLLQASRREFGTIIVFNGTGQAADLIAVKKAEHERLERRRRAWHRKSKQLLDRLLDAKIEMANLEEEDLRDGSRRFGAHSKIPGPRGQVVRKIDSILDCLGVQCQRGLRLLTYTGGLLAIFLLNILLTIKYVVAILALILLHLTFIVFIPLTSLETFKDSRKKLKTYVWRGRENAYGAKGKLLLQKKGRQNFDGDGIELDNDSKLEELRAKIHHTKRLISRHNNVGEPLHVNVHSTAMSDLVTSGALRVVNVLPSTSSGTGHTMVESVINDFNNPSWIASFLREQRDMNEITEQDEQGLDAAWELYRYLKYNAVRMKVDTYFYSYLTLFFNFLTVVIASASTLDEDVAGANPSDHKSAMQIIVVALPIITSLFYNLINKRNYREKWMHLRYQAQSVKSEIFQFRTRVGPYATVSMLGRSTAHSGRTVVLSEMLSGIREEMDRSDIKNAALLKPPQSWIDDELELLRNEEISLLSSKKEELQKSSVVAIDEDVDEQQEFETLNTADEGYSPLSPQDYIAVRVQTEIDWYSHKLPAYYKRLKLLEFAMYFFGALGSLLAALGQTVWVTVTITVASTFVSVMEMKRLQSKISKWNVAKNTLETVKERYEALDSIRKSNRRNVQNLVLATEETLQADVSAWMTTMKTANKRADELQNGADEDGGAWDKRDANRIKSSSVQ